MTLIIKNMVCNRCTMVVQDVLQKLKIRSVEVGMGYIKLSKPLSENKQQELQQELEQLGFEILDDPASQSIEQIKNLLIQKVQALDVPEHFSIQEFLTTQLNKEYSQISKLFSQVEGITIEQFFILQKIEKVKELLLYGTLNLSEIAWQLGYSSVQHLSSQFKKITGLTPTQLKENAAPHRKPLDGIN